MIKSFQISTTDSPIKNELQHKIDFKTKPLGALGKLEKLALQIGLIQGTLSPIITYPTLLVFAGDHGIVAEGVSPYPQEVTWQMVMNFVSGGAAINVFAKQNGWNLEVIDAGVNYDFPEELPIRNLKVGKGTKNFLNEPAMSDEELENAIHKGVDLVKEVFEGGSNCIAFGEMGIGNTSAAAIIMNKITGIHIEKCVGKGTGLDDAGITHKIGVLSQAIENHLAAEPLSILKTFGGFEIAMIYGAMLQAAELKMMILIDGFIITSALLIAQDLYPEILDYCIFSHQSDEKGHYKMLQYLKAD
ncbi:MAG: nicotinate-nucleotide--dimethylbenzimidazole phosphoribosyltransferase, partial [Bacteroidetes bacterium]|nr:nicotinate-nucleotide--dimethylbenzimidazole phosphoribosyltransferase [Bacteroidota bacterium]